MLEFLAGLAVAGAVPAEKCLAADPAEVVVERASLDGGAKGPFEAVSVSRRGDSLFGMVSSRVVVYAPDCSTAFEQQFDDTVETRMDKVVLGDQPALVLTAYEPGGSGCGYAHLILAYGKDRGLVGGPVYALAPMQLIHSNMDGFYVGPLGSGKSGLVT